MAACSGESGVTGSAAGSLGSSLVQRVTVSNASPAVGETITVRSVVINTGRVPAVVATTDAEQLQFSGVSFAPCDCAIPLGITQVPLNAGDSLVVETKTTAITATPGNYTLTVVQLNSPGHGVGIGIHVVAASGGRTGAAQAAH
ncbi:MAG TPA: hypothetical protein VGL65_07980 [Gemmatimonadales bacterium]